MVRFLIVLVRIKAGLKSILDLGRGSTNRTATLVCSPLTHSDVSLLRLDVASESAQASHLSLILF